jgi:hypothetical protein
LYHVGPEIAEAAAAVCPPAAFREAPSRAGAIRPFQPEDIPAAARLFQRVFRAGGEPAPALAACFRELFFEEADPELPSRVSIGGDGEVAGFLGVLPLVMTLRGRSIRAAVPTTLMVNEPNLNPFAALSLLKAFLDGPQELSLADTASPLVRALWLRLGGSAADAYGLDWWRILQPAGFAASRLAPKRSFEGLLRGAARGADRAFATVVNGRNPFALGPARTQSEEVDAEVLHKHLDALTGRIALRPSWGHPTLARRLAHAAQRTAQGPLSRRIVLAGGRFVGCYLCNASSGEAARVLELAAEPAACELVLADVAAHAAASGAVAVRGRTHPALAGALLQSRCFYTHRLSTLVRARDPEIMDAVRSGDALLTGLAGDSWTRLFDDEFA